MAASPRCEPWTPGTPSRHPRAGRRRWPTSCPAGGDRPRTGRADHSSPGPASTGRTSDITVTRSHRSSPIPGGNKWASAPSGIDREPSVAVALATLRPLSVGQGQTLIGQPGLADARRAVDHETVCPRVAHRLREQLELLVSPHEGPLQRHGRARVRRPYRRPRASTTLDPASTRATLGAMMLPPGTVASMIAQRPA